MDEIAAAYNDGKTAVTLQVKLYLNGDKLDIVGEDTTTIASWPLNEVHSIAKGSDGQKRRLRRGFNGPERITLDQEQDLEILASHCPNIHHTTPRSFGYWKPAITWSAVGVLSVFVLIKMVIPALAQQIVNVIPPSVEASLGRTAESQIIQFFALSKRKAPEDIICKDEEGVITLNALSIYLSSYLDTPVKTHVTVINHSMVNAFALPGGRILVFNGLIRDAKNGNDLAGVLAHEIGHLAKRHPLIYAFETAGISTLAALFFGDISGGVILGGLSQSLLDGAFTRNMERQADNTAISLLNRTGIGGEAFADFYLRLEKKYGKSDGLMSYFSTHPKPKERAQLVQSTTTGTNMAFTQKEWDSVYKICGEPEAKE